LRWLENIVFLEAAAAFVLASMNCRSLLGYALAARTAARRVGAGALASISAALSLEALVYLAQPALEADPEARELSLLLVRTCLLLASTVIAALLLRSRRRR
jgi:hypothetical protein